MKKWFACAALVLIAMTGIAWNCTNRSTRLKGSVACPDPHYSADAHRHFSGQSPRWGSMVLILD